VKQSPRAVVEVLQKCAIEIALVAEAAALNRVEDGAIGPNEHFLRTLQSSYEMVADGRLSIRPREQPDEMGLRERNQFRQFIDSNSAMEIAFHELIHGPLLGPGKSSIAAPGPRSFTVEFQQATREDARSGDHKFAIMAHRLIGAQGFENACQVPGQSIMPSDESQVLDMDSLEGTVCAVKIPKEAGPHVESDHPRLFLPAEPMFHLRGDNAKLRSLQSLLLNFIAVCPPCQVADGPLEKQAYLHVRPVAVHFNGHWIKVGVEQADVGTMDQVMGNRWRPGRQLDAEGVLGCC
jgi:hypothetical protein